MHSFGYRANALLAFSVTALAFICAIASLSDNFSNQNPSAEIQVKKNRLFIAVDLRRMKALIFEMMGFWYCGWWLQILNINRFKKQSYENDEVKVSIFNVKGSFLPWVMYVYELLLKLLPLSVVVSSCIFKPPRFPLIYCLLLTFFYMSLLQVSLTLDITADLESLFTWNTKQV